MEVLPSPSAVFLGIIRDSVPWFNVIIKIVEKKIRLITTMEYLRSFDPDAGQLPANLSDMQRMVDLIESHIAPVGGAVLCQYSAVERLLNAERKLETLMQVIAEGNAVTYKVNFS